MQSFKSIGGVLLGIVVLVGIIVATVLLFILGAKLAFTIQPFVNWLAGLLFVVNLIALLAAIAPKARGVSGFIIYVSSYVYGLNTWIFGLAVTLTLWGWIAVIIGIFMGGIGVVPVGMLAATFHGEWGVFWTLFMNLVLTYCARIIGTMLVSNVEDRGNAKERVVDGIVEESKRPKRAWRDIE